MVVIAAHEVPMSAAVHMRGFRTPGSMRLTVVLPAILTLSLAAQGAPGGIVAGQVMDGTSARPLASAVVTLTATTPPAPAAAGAPARPRAVSAVTNADGRFVFRDVPSGTYTLTSTLGNHAPGAYGRRRPGGPSFPLSVSADTRLTTAVLEMWRLASISGVIRDDRGEPVTGPYVTALRRTFTGGRLELTYAGGSGDGADDRGHYRINGLMPGNYVVAVRGGTQSVAVSAIDGYHAAVASGTVAPLAREFPYSGVIQLADAGLIIDGWQVSVSSGQLPPMPGPDGTVLLHPPVYFPNASDPSDATVLTLGPGDDRTSIDLTLPLMRGVHVSGTVTGPTGPAVFSGVRLVPSTAGTLFFDAPVAYTNTDHAGRFRFHGVTPGTYVVRAYRVIPTGPTFAFIPRPPGAPPGVDVETVPPPENAGPSMFAEVPVTVGSQHVDGIAVVLQPGARISGRVLFDGPTAPAAAQLQRVTLALKPLNGALPIASTQGAPVARVGADGRFSSTEYPPGRYHVDITPPAGWTVASIRSGQDDLLGRAITLDTRDVTDVVVTFTDRATTLSGTVRAADPGHGAESTILVVPANLEDWLATGMSPLRTATFDVPASGAYRLPITVPGDYVIVALTPELTISMEPEFLKRATPSGVRVTIAAGESKTQPLTISRIR
jgi:hypothetical protein